MTDTTDGNSSLSSVDSAERDPEYLHPEALFPTLSPGSRTTTVIDAVRDDNEFVREEDSRRIFPTTDPEINREDVEVEKELERTKTALSSYNGEFNKQDVVDRPPDGTFWGWMCAFLVMSINTFSWGVNSAFGVYLNYYIKSNKFPGANRNEFALVGGLGLGLSFAVCNIANTLVRRYPYKIVMMAGTILLTVCYLAAAECKSITALIFTQGFFLAIAYALVAGPSFVIIPTWFLKKRATATGIATAGAGLAGIIFSRPSEAIIEKTGSYKWGLRMIGIVCGVMLTISVLLLRSRRSLIVDTHQPLWKDIAKNFTRWDIYKQPAVLSVVLWNAVFAMGYTILLFSMSYYGSAIGLSHKQGSMVTTVQSVAQTIGRPSIGYLSSRYGNSNTTIVSSLFLAVICLTWWVFIESYGNLIAFGFVAGFIQGIGWVNFTPLCADVVGGGDDLLAAVSFVQIGGGPFYLVSEIIGLQLERTSMDKPFLYCQILVGVTIILSVILLIPLREFKVKRILKAQKHLIEKKNPEELTPEDSNRLKLYQHLLKTGARGYCLRTLYPVNV